MERARKQGGAGQSATEAAASPSPFALAQGSEIDFSKDGSLPKLSRKGRQVGLRGELYRGLAYLGGSEWRARLQEIKSCPPEEIGTRSLSRLLEHAVAKVPYYRLLGVSDLRLEAFPLLTRRTLQAEYDRLKSDDLASRGWSRTSTGGSTGEPVWVVHDRSYYRWNYATEMYYLEAFHGMPYREYLRSRRVSIWHRRRLRPGIGLLTHLAVKMLGQLIYLEPYSVLTEKRMTEYLRRINRHRPAVIIAFAGTAFELARHAKRCGIEVHSPRFVMVPVETLYPLMRGRSRRSLAVASTTAMEPPRWVGSPGNVLEGSSTCSRSSITWRSSIRMEIRLHRALWDGSSLRPCTTLPCP